MTLHNIEAAIVAFFFILLLYASIMVWQAADTGLGRVAGGLFMLLLCVTAAAFLAS